VAGDVLEEFSQFCFYSCDLDVGATPVVHACRKGGSEPVEPARVDSLAETSKVVLANRSRNRDRGTNEKRKQRG
jgi:hypothetical protein